MSKLSNLKLFHKFEPRMNIATTYKRRLLLSGYIILIFFVSTLAQTRVNPFEIKQRLKSMHIVDTFTPIQDNFMADSTMLSAAVQDSIPNENAKDDATDIANPFEVDHVPIRKSAIAKRTEKLQSQAESTHSSNGFIFWFLLFGCAILAIVMNMKVKALGLISKSIFNENMLKLFQREESMKFSPYLFLLYLIYCINLAAFVYLTSDFFGGPRGILIFIYALIGIIGIYLVRHVSLNLLGDIFSLTKNTQLYGFSIMIFNQFAGLVLIPLNFLLAFGTSGIKEIILWSTIIILCILLLLRTVRGIFIVSEYLTDRFFQIFIYLCAFEIAPMMVFIKTIMNLSK